VLALPVRKIKTKENVNIDLDFIVSGFYSYSVVSTNYFIKMTAIKNYKLRNVEKPNITQTLKNNTGQNIMCLT